MLSVSSADPASGGSLDPRGPVAAEIAELWWWLLGLGTLVFVVFLVFLVRSLLSRRRPDSSESPQGWIVGGGVVLPVLGVSVVLGLTLAAMRDLPDDVPTDAVTIEVIGHQWWWEVRYPDEDVVTANEIHIPVGRPVALRLSSVDVIHSFWVPALGGKIDLLPDRVNMMVLQADTEGSYQGTCAEFCGLQHAKMGILVVAEGVDDYRKWVGDQRAPAPAPSGDLATKGHQLFMEAECADCHTIRGREAVGTKGPDLTHLADRLTLAAGTLSNTSANLEDWVASPHDIKAGVDMPDLDLSETDLEALVFYLESLE